MAFAPIAALLEPETVTGGIFAMSRASCVQCMNFLQSNPLEVATRPSSFAPVDLHSGERMRVTVPEKISMPFWNIRTSLPRLLTSKHSFSLMGCTHV